MKISFSFALYVSATHGFSTRPSPTRSLSATSLSSSVVSEEKGKPTASEIKQELFALLGGQTKEGAVDPVLADPVTKEPLKITFKGPLLAGGKTSKNSVALDIRSSTEKYGGSSSSYINLLEPLSEDDSPEDARTALRERITKQLTPFLPPPVRAALSFAGVDSEYIPMRDLFTSPSVSYAYERGWRQGFAQAGFPGVDREFEMVREYFAPTVTDVTSSTIIDMSCATGLFTRRFAGEDTYDRVLGCDYSDSMLTEARRRIEADSKLNNLQKTQLDLVRLDVGQIPMQDGSVDALHAGAAMHCWPDLDAAVSEIYRVLKPGGRYFATTFLAPYFSRLQIADSNGASSGPTSQSYNYFTSKEEMASLLERNGFESDKISVEVLGAACLVIRCEK